LGEVDFQVSILKVDDKKRCIEVIKQSGDKFDFIEAYNKVKKCLGGQANTTLNG